MSSELPLPTPEAVAHVAALARLELDESQLDPIATQLGEILATAETMNQFELDDLEPTHHPLGLTNVMRYDERAESLDRDEVLDQAPSVEEERFRVPPALGEE